ncbi:MAG: hypothetical protein BZ136_06240 [Methanosphaera sp. rholeuAM74]|nr:MAG: hypothetical protein BZ136_06240 [Methanosphaera sp. rholeuAM74]
MLFVEQKELVLPGTLLTDNDYKLGRNTFKQKDKIYSDITGLAYFNSDNVTVIPLNYKYEPQYGDLIIGKVLSSSYSSWSIDLNSTYNGFLPTTELYDKNEQNLSSIINVNDKLLLRVAHVDEIKRVKLTIRSQGLGKFNQGVIIRVKQPTIHFLSEENAFLASMIRECTGSDIIIGKNGLIWINGRSEEIEKIIKIIEYIDERPFQHNLIKSVQNIIATKLII